MIAPRSASLNDMTVYSNSPPSSAGSHSYGRRQDSESQLSALLGSTNANVPDGLSVLEWVYSWDDEQVSLWLGNNKCGQYVQIFRENDIRGHVLLDVDQQALKEMSVQSVGDRIKIVVAIKKLRSACTASDSRRSTISSSQSNSSIAGTTNPSMLSLSSSSSSLKRSGSTRNQQRIPPPLTLHQNTTRHAHSNSVGQPRSQASNSSASSLLTAPTTASSGGLSPGGHSKRGTSPRQTPPAGPAPRGSLPAPPSSDLPAAPSIPPLRQRERQASANSLTSSTNSQTSRVNKYTPAWATSNKSNPNHLRSGSLGQQQIPSLQTLPGRPSTANTASSNHQHVYHYSAHPYASTGSPTREDFPQNPSSRPGTAKAHGLSPITEIFPSNTISSGLPPPASQRSNSENGYTVGRGGFSRPTTAAGTVSATASGLVAQQVPLEDLRRRTVKFTSDDGLGKTVDLDGARDAAEIFARVLRKFGKVNTGQSSHQLVRSRDGETEAFTEMDGWGIFASTSEGNVKALTDSELVAICFAANRPERQRGLILRRLHYSPEEQKSRPRFKNKLQNFFGEDVPAEKNTPGGHVSPTSPTYMLDTKMPGTAVEPASPTLESDDLAQQDDYEYTHAQQGRRVGNKMHRASTISVMSGLMDTTYPSNGVPNTQRSPSTGGSFLAGSGTKIRRFLGHRPPSEIIVGNMVDYFPSADSKTLRKTLRNSFRKSGKPVSEWGSVKKNTGITSWDQANTSRFSVSSAGSSGNLSMTGDEPPVPPLPVKDHFAPVALNERPPSDEIIKPAIQEPDSSPPTPEERHLNPADDPHHPIRSASRMSMASRKSSRLSVRTSRSGRDSDSASMLTVDEITAEVEHRRMSMGVWTAEQNADAGNDDTKSIASFGRKSSFGGRSIDGDADHHSILEEEDEEEESDDDEDEDEDEAEGDSAHPKLTSNGTKTEIKWIKGALIGAGSFGQVFLAMNAINGTLMAVKQVEIPSADTHNGSRKKSMLEALEREIELLKGLQHENIVQYLDSSSDTTHLNIFLEYVPGGSVVALLRNYGAFEEPLVRTFVRQILLGLNYLHEREIIHRDIKGANILVDNKGAIKISDFGISKKVEDNLLSNPRVHRPSLQGSVFWMAPEVVKQTVYTNKADIWSVGCVIIEMLTGDHPHINLNQMQALFKIGSMLASPEIPTDISESAQDFLKQTFLVDHDERPSAETLLQSSFMMALSTPTAKTFSI